MWIGKRGKEGAVIDGETRCGVCGRSSKVGVVLRVRSSSAAKSIRGMTHQTQRWGSLWASGPYILHATSLKAISPNDKLYIGVEGDAVLDRTAYFQRKEVGTPVFMVFTQHSRHKGGWDSL